MHRRGFVKWLMSFTAGVVLSRCGQNSPSSDRSFTSTLTGGHGHSVTITQESWTYPPAPGWSYTTTNNFQHTHSVTLSYEQLISLGQGNAITVESSASNHSHIFTLRLVET